ncbi:hypothetical protein PPACK8108_LOCUS26364 [Phakopsora pachyrhizi]|uniref:Uncharacterized protein n=1 Tax=Phakopsora pachyrhizi TaxID=170000 RepID=A0AAV0BX67_PHAPC|nr:hypothetical protein PPACK8108_LOCUS26364 [Phakopsora pachyrhizi]
MRSKMERWKGRIKCSPIDLQENKKKVAYTGHHHHIGSTPQSNRKFSRKECCHLALQLPRWPGSQSEDYARADSESQMRRPVLDHENMIAIDIDFKDPMGMVRWQILMISSSSSRCLIDPTPLPSTNPVRVESDSKGSLEVDHQAYWLGVPLNAVDKSLTRELKRRFERREESYRNETEILRKPTSSLHNPCQIELNNINLEGFKGLEQDKDSTRIKGQKSRGYRIKRTEEQRIVDNGVKKSPIKARSFIS